MAQINYIWKKIKKLVIVHANLLIIRTMMLTASNAVIRVAIDVTVLPSLSVFSQWILHVLKVNLELVVKMVHTTNIMEVLDDVDLTTSLLKLSRKKIGVLQ